MTESLFLLGASSVIIKKPANVPDSKITTLITLQ